MLISYFVKKIDNLNFSKLRFESRFVNIFLTPEQLIRQKAVHVFPLYMARQKKGTGRSSLFLPATGCEESSSDERKTL